MQNEFQLFAHVDFFFEFIVTKSPRSISLEQPSCNLRSVQRYKVQSTLPRFEMTLEGDPSSRMTQKIGEVLYQLHHSSTLLFAKIPFPSFLRDALTYLLSANLLSEPAFWGAWPAAANAGSGTREQVLKRDFGAGSPADSWQCRSHQWWWLLVDPGMH